MVQWASWSGRGPHWLRHLPFDGWIDLGGIHLELRHRHRGDGLTYGPYVDLHLGLVVVSLGLNPIYAGEIDLKTSVAIARELG